MYKLVKTQETTKLYNGSELHPILTLKSESGGICHIYEDDHCYVVGLERNGIVQPTYYIFSEALEAIRRLPPLSLDITVDL